MNSKQQLSDEDFKETIVSYRCKLCHSDLVKTELEWRLHVATPEHQEKVVQYTLYKQRKQNEDLRRRIQEEQEKIENRLLEEERQRDIEELQRAILQKQTLIESCRKEIQKSVGKTRVEVDRNLGKRNESGNSSVGDFRFELDSKNALQFRPPLPDNSCGPTEVYQENVENPFFQDSLNSTSHSRPFQEHIQEHRNVATQKSPDSHFDFFKGTPRNQEPVVFQEKSQISRKHFAENRVQFHSSIPSPQEPDSLTSPRCINRGQSLLNCSPEDQKTEICPPVEPKESDTRESVNLSSPPKKRKKLVRAWKRTSCKDVKPIDTVDLIRTNSHKSDTVEDKPVDLLSGGSYENLDQAELHMPDSSQTNNNEDTFAIHPETPDYDEYHSESVSQSGLFPQLGKRFSRDYPHFNGDDVCDQSVNSKRRMFTVNQILPVSNTKWNVFRNDTRGRF